MSVIGTSSIIIIFFMMPNKRPENLFNTYTRHDEREREREQRDRDVGLRNQLIVLIQERSSIIYRRTILWRNRVEQLLDQVLSYH